MSFGDRALPESPVCAWTLSVSYPITSETSASKKCTFAQAPVASSSSAAGTETALERAIKSSTQKCHNFVGSAKKKTLISRKAISNAALLTTQVTGLPRRNCPRPWSSASQVTPKSTSPSNFRFLELVFSLSVTSQPRPLSHSEEMMTSGWGIERVSKDPSYKLHQNISVVAVWLSEIDLQPSDKIDESSKTPADADIIQGGVKIFYKLLSIMKIRNLLTMLWARYIHPI